MVRRTAEIFLSDADDIEVLLAKYGINGFWTQEHFDQHEIVKESLIKNDIELPKWFEELSIKQHAVSYDDGKNLRYFDDEDEAKAYADEVGDRKSTRLNSSHVAISYAVFCLKKKKKKKKQQKS